MYMGKNLSIIGTFTEILLVFCKKAIVYKITNLEIKNL
jgi:hypothetical protein